MNPRSTLILLAIVPMTAVGQDYTGSKSDIDNILDAVKQFSRSYMSADYEGLANSYSIGAKNTPPSRYYHKGEVCNQAAMDGSRRSENPSA